MSVKEFVFEDSEKAINTYRVWESKLKEMYKSTPVFWYSIGLTSTQDGKHIVTIDTGKLKELNLNINDIKLS